MRLSAGRTARWIGTVPALGLHSLVLLAGILPLRKMSSPKKRRSQGSLHLSDVIEGVREVRQSPALSATLLLAVAVGIFFIGPFLVVLPLLVRDFYHGGVDQLALLNMAFPLGTILARCACSGRWIRIRAKPKSWPSCSARAASLWFRSACPSGAPCWPCAPGSERSHLYQCRRTVYQEQASVANRARVLSVYTIGFMGAAGLLGAPLSGILVDAIGPLTTCVVMSSAMVVVVGFVFLRTAIRQVE